MFTLRQQLWRKLSTAHLIQLSYLLGKPISIITSSSDGGLVSTPIGSLAGRSGKSTVVVSQLYCSLVLPNALVDGPKSESLCFGFFKYLVYA